MRLLKSCKHCGRIHDSKHDCGRKPVRKKWTENDKFRSTFQWQRKREQIRERDLHLCRVCLHNNMINYDDLSVHHIETLESEWDKRLDDDNLITLCQHHHELAESGGIPVELLKELAKQSPGGVHEKNT